MSELADAALRDDEATQASAFVKLRSIYDREAAAGRSDPMLTEALADVTDDPRNSASLYRLAMAQSASFPDEPLHTKRIGLARQLIELGDLDGAEAELNAALLEAKALGDDDVLEMIKAVRGGKRPNKSLERTREG
ncbi:hypothetical protein RHDC3_02677 [Rhodocyclaceae bacterium]|nr:hypothetical protein RHDC3_02677 [Rhodocyclaceae bacterium]